MDTETAGPEAKTLLTATEGLAQVEHLRGKIGLGGGAGADFVQEFPLHLGHFLQVTQVLWQA